MERGDDEKNEEEQKKEGILTEKGCLSRAECEGFAAALKQVEIYHFVFFGGCEENTNKITRLIFPVK